MKLRVEHHSTLGTQKLPKIVGRIIVLCDSFADGDLETTKYVSGKIGLVCPKTIYSYTAYLELDNYTIRNNPGKQNKRLWGNQATIAYAKKLLAKGEDI